MAITINANIELRMVRAEQIGSSNMNIYFARPRNFMFEAGDWIDLYIPGKNLRGGITYSLSSSPTESELMISFKLGISEFKKYLQSLKTGDKMYISQYGNAYDFNLKENRSSIFIAGGIGIAPFRSMLKEMVDTRNRNEIQLLYFNKERDFLFQEEISEWQTTLNLDVHYIQTETLKRKDRLRVYNEVMRKDGDFYFIAGPEGMVESTEHMLIDMGIDLDTIRIDSFGGY